jgi:hypothetical protein
MNARKLALAALPLVLLVACDSNKARSENISNVEKKEVADPAMEKAMAERKAKREADEKAKAEAEEAKRAAIAKIVVVPPKLEKKVEKACDAVAAAQDRFMERLHTGEVLEKWRAAKENQLPMTIVQCATISSLEVAGCQVNALDNAPPELKENVDEILKACADKYGPKGPPPGSQPGGAGEIPKIPTKPG